MIPRHLGSSSFSLIIDDTIALDCILNSCCNHRVPFQVQVLRLKTNSASSNTENPLAISCTVISPVLQFLLLPLSLFVLPLGFQFLVLLSSANYITAAFTLPSRHPGLEVKTPSSCPPHCTVQSSTQKRKHLQRMHAHDNVLQTRELTA